MALGENQSNLPYIKATPYQASAGQSSEVIRASANGMLHGIIFSSHSPNFAIKLWNSATGPANAVFGTFTPPAGSQVLNFSVPIEFSNGIFVTNIPETAPTGNVT